jgi:hypothetical protein
LLAGADVEQRSNQICIAACRNRRLCARLWTTARSASLRPCPRACFQSMCSRRKPARLADQESETSRRIFLATSGVSRAASKFPHSRVRGTWTTGPLLDRSRARSPGCEREPRARKRLIVTRARGRGRSESEFISLFLRSRRQVCGTKTALWAISDMLFPAST